MHYHERYLKGEHRRVWAEQTGLSHAIRDEPLWSEARGVAHEPMLGARRNVELLIERLNHRRPAALG